MPSKPRSTTVQYHRRTDLAGLELSRIEHCQKPWDHLVGSFELIASTGLTAIAWHRGREWTLRPGTVLCARPGEVVSLRHVRQPGGWVSVGFEPERLLAVAPRASSSDARPVPDEPRPAVSDGFDAPACDSTELELALLQLFELLPHATAREVARHLLTIGSALWLAQSRTSVAAGGCSGRDAAAERLLEWIADSGGHNVDLSTLAGLAGLSRFQTVRVFKRRYGLPPHAYQLRMRLNLAKEALRRGVQPARVAADLGFADQSHLTRHFRRALGVTPAHYARMGGPLAPANGAAQRREPAGPLEPARDPQGRAA